MNLLLQWNLLFPAKESAVRYLNKLFSGYHKYYLLGYRNILYM